MTLPTWVTLSRLLVLPILLYYLENPTPETRWLSVVIFLIAALTDWVDGYLARRLNQITELGKFLDPLVDKLLILAPLLALNKLGQVPTWGVFLILARELTIAGWRVTPSLTGNTAIAGANFWGKLKTVSQIAAIALLIAPLPVDWQFPLIAFWVAVALTLISGVIYLLPATDKISSSTEKSTSAVSPPEVR
ncbi:CDP-diacylglycerol--glycerol-3-phosphate 3-phosphatidyltransferase [Gloeocapsopsis dulcis]|uniref:CDP-diacylglycerol--glycerol-3-phosphate 3-phosphatidyltransferase n=1 Tax=Gloeocapsopsis dulcis AAB1 = 1H9 TaxID=1433147 RepID=A0A6N8FPB3_9CHRO|nr:CDP-diacylglycerol--glycerol-3-phosphate 3-phosphatidyltransferase [Gloeocapsopsis dulcis]MUL35150.1 CDP-diacylglycerol--glycerol-3-phosphate 3-phosphatidyltransferase [Gloeocapsopsis dulcis AAB1 = 1H9]WNN92051.1 CDP-diacylglycerol--glycerol-3-phosphate 3-phosphatidyltransferase [Gloeocapsopsis dulcis]